MFFIFFRQIYKIYLYFSDSKINYTTNKYHTSILPEFCYLVRFPVLSVKNTRSWLYIVLGVNNFQEICLTICLCYAIDIVKENARDSAVYS